ncbi:zinc finger BED domain-containing protein RICESLEEPER 2 [Tanacetum coccineum]|uniref:Zinc finger BED domain-containing protein RICESLEEPER 2 n=1 Tax=Tanacetum coccineum TaxID=301880 RepID=A0ABQ5HUN8_9ASTR
MEQNLIYSSVMNVEFKVVEGGISSIEFNKEHLIFYLPAITVNENTKVILRNLVAYETTRMKSCDTIQFAEYVDLMCGIIDKPRDVELLRKRNIVEVQDDMDDEEIANLFNGIKNLLRTGGENMDSTRPWLRHSVTCMVVAKTSYRNNKYGLEFQDGRLATRSLIGFHASFKDIPKKVQWNDPTMSLRGIINISKRILSSHLHPNDFATFDVLGFWKAKENQFPVLSRVAMDILSVQASSIASESAFSTSGRLLTIRRTRLTPESLEMCMCLKDHLDAQERKQDTSPLELPLDVEEGVFNVDVQQNEATQLTDQEITLDASSDGSSGEPRHD